VHSCRCKQKGSHSQEAGSSPGLRGSSSANCRRSQRTQGADPPSHHATQHETNKTHTRGRTHSTLSLLLRSTVGTVARKRQREGGKRRRRRQGLARTEPRGDFRAASVCWTSLWCSSRSFLSVSIASAAPRATTRCEHAHKPQSADRQVRKRLGGRERSGRSNRTLDLPAPSAASPEAARSAPYWCSLATAPALSGPPSRRPQTSA
jgi:hypothetical protein